MPKRSTRLLSGKRITVNTRVTPELRSALEQASEASGRSLSHEIEHRLELAMRDGDAMRVIRETIRQEMRAEFAARQTSWQVQHTAPGSYSGYAMTFETPIYGEKV